MARHTHKVDPYQRLAMGVFLVMFLAGFYIVTSQLTGWHVPGVSRPVNQAAPMVPCASTDKSYCSLMRQLVPAVEAGNFSFLLARQVANSITCPSVAVSAYCGNVANGVPISLFTVYQADRPTLLMRNDYIAFLRSYIARTGKLVHIDAGLGIQSPLLFRDQQGTVRLELQLQQTSDGVWQFLWPDTTS